MLASLLLAHHQQVFIELLEDAEGEACSQSERGTLTPRHCPCVPQAGTCMSEQPAKKSHLAIPSSAGGRLDSCVDVLVVSLLSSSGLWSGIGAGKVDICIHRCHYKSDE